MADDQLTIQINADVGSTTSDIEAVNAKIAAMETELRNLRAAHDSAGDAVESHTKKETIFGETIGKVEASTNALGRTFSAIGFPIGEATERIQAFGESLEGLEAAASPILLITAGLLGAAAAAFSLFEGIRGAGDLDAALGQIAASAHATGSAFTSTKAEVKQWAEDISTSTGASAEALVAGVQRMVAANIPLTTAQALEKDAELEAIASGRSLGEVQDALEQAYLGRTRGLVALGIITKEEAKNGIELSVVNDRILSQTKEAVDVYANSLPGSLAIAEAKFKQLTETLGGEFVSSIVAGVQRVGDFISSLNAFAESVLPAAKASLSEFAKTFEPVFDALKRTEASFLAMAGSVEASIQQLYGFLKPIFDDVGKTMLDTIVTALTAIALDFKTAFDAIIVVTDLFKTDTTGNFKTLSDDLKVVVADMMESIENIVGDGAARAAAAIQTMVDELKKNALNAASVVGGIATGNPTLIAQGVVGAAENAGDAGADFSQHLKTDKSAIAAYEAQARAIEAARQSSRGGGASVGDSSPSGRIQDREIGGETPKATTPEDVQLIGPSDGGGKFDDSAYKAENADLKALVSSEDEYREAVKLATNADDERTAKMALANKETVDATVSVNMLKDAIASEKASIAEASAEYATHSAAAKALQEAHDRLALAVNAAGHASKEQTEELKDLKAAQELHKKAADESSAAVAALTSEIESNSSALETQKQKIDAVAAAYAEQTRAMGEAFAKDLEQQQEEDKKRQVQQAGVAEENALYGLSLSQQLGFYQRRFANEVAAGNQYTDQAKADWSKIISLEGDVYKQRLEEQKAFIESAQTLEKSFLDDVLTKHQSLRDSLKDIFKSIEADFVSMLEQMILKSSLLNGLNQQLEKIFNVGGGAGTGGAGASIPGLGGLLGGGGIGSAGSSAIGASSIVTGLDSPGQNSLVDIGSQSIAAINSAPGIGGNGVADIDAAGGGGANWGNAGPSFGTVAGAGLTGVGLGGLAASITGGNSMYGSVLGGLGGIAASLGGLAGPAGLAVSLGAGLLGSLFTGGQPTAAKDPDEFEGQTGYGQDVADLQFGQSNANGTFYYPDAAIAKFVAAMDVSAGTINGGANQGQQRTNSNGTIASSGGVDAAEMWLYQNKSDTSAQLEAMGVSPAQFSQWVSLLGESATGSGQYTHYDKNVGDIEITGADTGGNTKTTTAAAAAALQAIVAASGNSSSSTSSVFTVGRTYPNMNLGTLNADGTYTQTAVAAGGTGSTSTTPGSTKAGTVTTGSASSDAMNGTPIAGGVGEIHLHLTIEGGNTILGASSIQDFANKIAGPVSIALGRYQSGQLAGGIASRSNRSGNF